MEFRWPKKLRLVATGEKVEEHEDGDWRMGHWHSDIPMASADWTLATEIENAEMWIVKDQRRQRGLRSHHFEAAGWRRRRVSSSPGGHSRNQTIESPVAIRKSATRLQHRVEDPWC